jgi:hypothetical protein
VEKLNAETLMIFYHFRVFPNATSAGKPIARSNCLTQQRLRQIGDLWLLKALK